MEIKNISRYEVKRELGRGGMATVYLAYDPSFDREVAIKILPREFLHNPDFLERFQREVRTIAKLEHPAIVPVYDVGEHDGMPFLVMRFMPGGSLSDRIATRRFSLQETARMVERLAAALSYAHRKGVVHRDLKPDNILFNADDYAFISDFGIARFAESQSTLTGSGIIGTPAYMSPEQATGDVLDQRSDVYGLGVIVYQMLTGEKPYKADTPMGVAIKHVTDPVPDILSVAPELPAGVSDVMKTVLAKDREQRYPSAVEFARALNQAAFGDPGSLKESTPTVQPSEKVKPAAGSNTRYYVAGAIGILVLLISLFAAGRFFSRQPESSATVVPTAVFTSEPESSATVVPTPIFTREVVSAVACGEQVLSSYTSLIKQTRRGCTGAVPYTNYLIPKGATFTVQDPDFTCTLAATRDDGDVISCFGRELTSFQIEFCNLPDAPQLVTGSGQCPEGSGFDEANQCCAPVSENGTACFLFTAGTTECK